MKSQGRPATGRKFKTRSCCLPEDIDEKLVALSVREQLPVTYFIRKYVQDGLANDADK